VIFSSPLMQVSLWNRFKRKFSPLFDQTNTSTVALTELSAK
jgi:hypothetical protein